MKKPTRNTQIKAIAAEQGSLGKLGAAVGMNLSYDLERPRDDREIAAILSDAAAIADLNTVYRNREMPAEVMQTGVTTYSHVGAQIIAAIQAGDWIFLSKLAAAVQYRSKPEEHPIAREILSYCHLHGCGTDETPCDALKLERHLAAAGTSYTKEYDNQVARGLRALCQRLGVKIATIPQGGTGNK